MRPVWPLLPEPHRVSKLDQTDEHRAAVHIQCGSRRRAGCYYGAGTGGNLIVSEVFGCSTSLGRTCRVPPGPDHRNAVNDGVKENRSLAESACALNDEEVSLQQCTIKCSDAFMRQDKGHCWECDSRTA